MPQPVERIVAEIMTAAVAGGWHLLRAQCNEHSRYLHLHHDERGSVTVRVSDHGTSRRGLLLVPNGDAAAKARVARWLRGEPEAVASSA